MNEMQKIKMVIQLQEQEKVLEAIITRRKALAEQAKKAGCYDQVYEMLFGDGEKHWHF